MTNEEALKLLKMEKSDAERYFFKQSNHIKMYDKAIEAIEKQIPVKPKRDDNDRTYCPICMNPDIRWIRDFHDSYCWSCGQRLDWSDENDE